MRLRCPVSRCAPAWILALVLVVSVLTALCRADERESLNGALSIGGRREMFVDRYLIDQMENLRLALHEPVEKGVAIRFDKPWEYPFAGCPTVIKDGAKYRLYYRGMSGPGDGTSVESTCYAESEDGIQWTKPNLGLFEVQGTRENNCVYACDPPFSHNFTPFLDTRPGADAQSRYKAISGAGASGGVWVFGSPDGIHWRKLCDRPVITEGAFDSQNVAFWSEHEARYVCYFRTWKGGWEGCRWISRTASDDFLNWSKPVAMVFRHGDELAPDEHLYTNATHPYFRAPQVYIAMPFRFMPGRGAISAEQAKAVGVDPKYAADCSDGVLMTSRGGNIYDRTFLESFLRPGIGWENWVSRTNMPALGIVPTGEHEMSMYAVCNYAQPTVHLKRYAMRLDGFASVQASYHGGQLLSRPLIFAGKQLQVNFATSAAGSIRVELQDTAGKPIPGYGLADCFELVGNEIVRLVAWKKGNDVSGLAGKAIRIRFVLKDADLYALQFQ